MKSLEISPTVPHRHYHSSRHRASLFSTDAYYGFRQRHGEVPDLEEFISSLEKEHSHQMALPDQQEETRQTDEMKQASVGRKDPESEDETNADTAAESTISDPDLPEKDLSPFTQWLLTRQMVVQEDSVKRAADRKVQETTQEDSKESSKNRLDKSDNRKKKKKKKKKAAARASLVLSNDIFSETLADLLASQGHREKAIEMYEKMRLIYPEKSRFFAAKIAELKKTE